MPPNKLKYVFALALGALFAMGTAVYAGQVTVPSAVSGGQTLVGLSSGNYQATSTLVNINGLIGISTSTPTNALEVKGTIYGTGYDFFGTNPTGVTGTASIVLSTNPALAGTVTTANLRTGTAGAADLEVLGATAINRNTAQLILSPLATTTDSRLNTRGSTAFVGTWGASYGTYDIGEEPYTLNAQSTSVAPLLSQLGIRSLNVTTGAGGVTDMATLYVAGGAVGTGVTAGKATEGNYAVWVASSTSVSRFDGSLSVASTSPYAMLSVHANSNNAVKYNTLFAIGSSTASATSTLFSIDNTGNITTAMTGTQCVHEVNGLLSGTGSDCSAGGGGAFAWTPTTFGSTAANSTSTLIGFTKGLYALSSTTIGDGTKGGGLTVSGGATTTGVAYFGGGLGLTNATSSAVFIDGGNGRGLVVAGATGANTAAFTIANYNSTTCGAGNPSYGALDVSNNAMTFYAPKCSNGRIVFDDNSGAESARFSGNNFGIGDNIPASKLSVAGNAAIGFAANSGQTAPTNGLTVVGLSGFGSTTPYARLSVHANNGDTNTTLFAIGSSTAGATTTLFSIDNTGNLTTRLSSGLVASAGAGTNLYAAATSSIAVSAGLTTTGTLGSQVGGTALTLKQVENRCFSFATTSWTGTTTIPLGIGYGESWNWTKAFTDSGTLNIDLYHASTHFTFFNASTTKGQVSQSAATDTSGDSVFADIGTPASSPTKITVCVNDTI